MAFILLAQIIVGAIHELPVQIFFIHFARRSLLHHGAQAILGGATNPERLVRVMGTGTLGHP
jgi:hypothetical protein